DAESHQNNCGDPRAHPARPEFLKTFPRSIPCNDPQKPCWTFPFWLRSATPPASRVAPGSVSISCQQSCSSFFVMVVLLVPSSAWLGLKIRVHSCIGGLL